MSARRWRRGHPEPMSVPIPLGRCRRQGKIRWESRADARRHLRSLLASGDTGLSTYRCADGCGDWRVGHRRRSSAA